jgi:hypothetical protein
MPRKKGPKKLESQTAETKKPDKIIRDSNMIRFQYAFTVDEQERIMSMVALMPDIELGVITTLINDNAEEWPLIPFGDRMGWIADEVICETISMYLNDICLDETLEKEKISISDDVEIIFDRSYEGDTLIVSLAVILDSAGKEDNKVVSIFKKMPIPQ